MNKQTATSTEEESQPINQKEPIAAIATPVGEGGIAVIRVSGQNAIATVNQAFEGTNLTEQESHTVHFGKIQNQDGEIVDEVLATLFHSPKSYTGEETVEISCHGGVLVTQAVLEAMLDLGIRSAEPGEFTQRAFLNGKRLRISFMQKAKRRSILLINSSRVGSVNISKNFGNRLSTPRLWWSSNSISWKKM